ncbi:MAG: cytochrome c3 family protein [Thermodesulfobacteriota bacterium]|nr:cytochrome c3 family protein [Thermodesulfobacteriota bacterium]
MKKAAVFIFAITVGTAFLFVSAYSQEEMTFVDNSVFPKPERTSSVFRHDEHNEKAGIEECNQCHHVYEDGKLMQDESSEDRRCSDCHELKSTGSAPDLMKAYHMNCKGCHLKQKKGPIMCGECHQK